jgi:hypothetical protein
VRGGQRRGRGSACLTRTGGVAAADRADADGARLRRRIGRGLDRILLFDCSRVVEEGDRAHLLARPAASIAVQVAGLAPGRPLPRVPRKPGKGTERWATLWWPSVGAPVLQESQRQVQSARTPK